MSKKLFVIVSVSLFFLVSFVVAANFISSRSVGGYNITSSERCFDQVSYHEEAIYSPCNTTITKSVCSDAPLNTSCLNVQETFTQRCHMGFRNVERVSRSCRKEFYDVGNVRLNVDGYNCAFNRSGRKLVAMCDSVYDGNGDGVCQSGESCQKFVINGDSVQKFEKNSLNDFVENDEFFAVQKASS